MSEIDAYWWSRFGLFAPGVSIYPHMGQVIAEYRIRRGFQTQKALAIALGYSERTIQELEGSMNLDAPDSIERRMVLARLLQIPPCLLALDWRFMAYKDNTVDQESPFSDMVGLMEEDTYDFYDDLLAIGWESTYKGGSPQTATRITKRLGKTRKAYSKCSIQRARILVIITVSLLSAFNTVCARSHRYKHSTDPLTESYRPCEHAKRQ